MYFTYCASIIFYFVFFKKERKFTATLHHFPNKKLKRIFLKKLSEQIEKVVVHGEYISKQAEKIGIKNCIVVDYPAYHENNYNQKDAKKKLSLPLNSEIITLLCMGETRETKGLDILLKALNKVNNQKFLLIIAGREGYYDRNYIENMSNDFDYNIILNFKFIPHDLFGLYFKAGDVVVLPYKKNFSGQSGPLIEGVNNDCYILASNVGKLVIVLIIMNWEALFRLKT